MKEKDSIRSYVELCRNCAELCRACASRWKHNASMQACMLVCRITAARCEQVIMYPDQQSVFERCAEACIACAHECEKNNDPYCVACAEACRKCAGECLQMAA